MDIDSDLYKEFLVLHTYNNMQITHMFASANLKETGIRDLSGAYASSSNNSYSNVIAAKKSMTCSAFVFSGTDVTSSSTMTVYGRK